MSIGEWDPSNMWLEWRFTSLFDGANVPGFFSGRELQEFVVTNGGSFSLRNWFTILTIHPPIQICFLCALAWVRRLCWTSLSCKECRSLFGVHTSAHLSLAYPRNHQPSSQIVNTVCIPTCAFSALRRVYRILETNGGAKRLHRVHTPLHPQNKKQ